MAKNKNSTKSSINFFQKNWGIILNASITIIIGVVVAIYLQKDQQKFEVSKEESSQEAQFANMKIAVTASCSDKLSYYCVEALEISNESNVIAKNIKIAVVLVSVGKQWAKEIDSINDFEVATTNPAFAFTTTDKLDTSKISLGNYIKLIEIKSLPPKSNAVFMMTSKSLSESQNATNQESKDILFVVPNGDQLPKEEFTAYLKQNYYIASFNAFFSCENCKAENQQQVQFTLPIIESWTNEGGIEILSFGDAPSELVKTIKFFYVSTENTDTINLPNCLKWVKSPDGKVSLTPYVTTPQVIKKLQLFYNIDCESTWEINK